jgi:hypothetical protein
MEYMRAYNYVFENPNWGMNLFWGFLCLVSTILIPVIGQLIFLGYMFEVIDGLLANRGGRYPDFDINRFGDYLARSLWPFLVKLVVAVVAVPVVLIVIAIPAVIMGLLAAAVGEDNAGIVVAIGVPLLVLVIISIGVLVSMVILPLVFRAGMTQSFAEGFNFGWAMDFAKKTWLEMFLAMLFLVFSAMVLGIIGLILCYLPVFAVGALAMLAEGHLMYQLYLLYLSRGGMPLPLKVGAPVPMGPPPTGAPA